MQGETVTDNLRRHLHPLEPATWVTAWTKYLSTQAGVAAPIEHDFVGSSPLVSMPKSSANAKFLEQGIVLLDRWVVRGDRGLL